MGATINDVTVQPNPFDSYEIRTELSETYSSYFYTLDAPLSDGGRVRYQATAPTSAYAGDGVLPLTVPFDATWITSLEYFRADPDADPYRFYRVLGVADSVAVVSEHVPVPEPTSLLLLGTALLGALRRGRRVAKLERGVPTRLLS